MQPSVEVHERHDFGRQSLSISSAAPEVEPVVVLVVSGDAGAGASDVTAPVVGSSGVVTVAGGERFGSGSG